MKDLHQTNLFVELSNIKHEDSESKEQDSVNDHSKQISKSKITYSNNFVIVQKGDLSI